MQIFLDKDKQPQYYRVYSMQKETPLFLLHSFSSLSLRFRASPSGPPRAAKPFRMPPGAARAAHPAYALSNSPAAPIPPPMHMVTNPNFASRRFIS
jgi:hypothetical protein